MLSLLLAMASTVRTTTDDQHALERMKRGEEGALAELYDRHGRFVYALALRIVRDRGDAEDITQDVFVQAWKQSDRFDAGRGHVVAWLLNIARARAIDLLRRRRSRPQPAEHDASEEATDLEPGQDVQLDWSRRAAAVQQAMASLPVLQRMAVELAFFEGLTHAEIAEQLEVPLGTIKTRVRQGLLKLRDSLAGAAS